MSEKILLGRKNNFSLTTNRLFFNFGGVVYGFLGVFKYYRDGFSVSASMWIITGFLLFLYGLLAFSKNSRLAPRVENDNEKIKFKTNILIPSSEIFWDDLDSIQFSSHRIIFITNGQNKILNYSSSPEISINIKQSIREYCDQLDIKIDGG